MNYNRINNIAGWLAFVIAMVVYLATMAPTASFWDCGEFIAASNELQVPHPPGAPFFLILGRFFAIFGGTDPAGVAWWINLMSAMSSAFTVLLTFWIITYLSKLIIAADEKEPSQDKIIPIMFAGMVGALGLAFSDSFWFNAVEAEVYAMSSFMTAAVVWLILKWHARADEPDHLKWIILIAFVMGVSICVHLLNLLTIPALALVYYFRKTEKATPIGMGIALGIGVVLLGFVQKFVIQYSVELAWWVERTFVGTEPLTPTAGEALTGWGLPMMSGGLFFGVLFIGFFAVLVWMTQREERMPSFMSFARRFRVQVNVLAMSVIVILMGYSSYALIVIRANADPPMNQNDPSNFSNLISYLKREQYGENPLLSGPLYNNAYYYKSRKAAPQFLNLKEERALPDGDYTLKDGKTFSVKGGTVSGITATDRMEAETKDGRMIAIDGKTMKATRIETRYVYDGYKEENYFESRYKVLFPRMHSPSHYNAGPYGYSNYVKRKGATPSPVDDSPTSAEDWDFFFDYQMRHMYWRYFMWNFVGREGDVQDMGWESGLNFSQSGSMPEIMRNDPGRNHYFYLPLLLGLFGMVFHFSMRWKDATSILMLFFFTGIAIIIYLNQTPQQPRERDYSYVGSFQTFYIWVGLGVIALSELIKKYLKNLSGFVAGGVGLLCVPAILAVQNWDDHTRHKQLVPPDSAYNLLMSCKKNGIIFTNGDNDTFPLWYLQEVEGVRTDVRVVNLSLLNTDWYINQMKKQSNDSPPLPITIPETEYTGERNAYFEFKETKVNIPVDRQAVIENGVVRKEDQGRILSSLEWTIKPRGGGDNSYLLKQDLLIRNLVENIAKDGWKRPIYFSSTIPGTSYMNLQDYFQMEGLAYRLVPVRKAERLCTDQYGCRGWIDLDHSYSLLMDTFRYRNLTEEGLYLDYHIRQTIIGNLQSTVYRVANGYTDEYIEGQAMVKDLRAKIDLAKAAGATAAVDSMQTLLNRYQSRIEPAKDHALKLLQMVDERIGSSAGDADIFYVLLSGSIYKRLGQIEKGNEVLAKLRDRIGPVMSYYGKEEYAYKDRFLAAMNEILRSLQESRDYAGAAVAAGHMYDATGDMQFKAAQQSFQSRPGGGGDK